MSEILTIIVSGDLIRRFNEHDITSQELIDGSYVIVDDFRIKVYLAQ